MRKINKCTKIKEIAFKYVKNNSKEYILTILIFLTGLFLGIMFVNNYNEDKINIISNYINDFINTFKQTEQIDRSTLFMNSIRNDLILTIFLWISGTTIIGVPVVFGIILYRGFCLGTTIASTSIVLGFKKGIAFCFLTLFLQNLLFVPAIITIGVSSIKLYKSIISDRRKENIKTQILLHTLISIVMFFLLIFSSFLENEISVRLLKVFIVCF